MINLIRISVYIVSYNQEKYIRQSIESVLGQSISPYEICIFDDHSTDQTWNIIQEYQQIYPDIIKAYRHEVNQGIFKNLNFAESHLNGNLITAVAGDDFIMPGYFEDAVRCIEQNNLDPDKDSFIIVPNIISLLEDGSEIRYSNVKYQDKNLLFLRLRGLIDDRYGLVSRSSFNKTSAYIENIGIHSDFVWGIDRYLHTDKVLFIDGYYPVYRMGVGIVSRTKEIDFAQSMIQAIDVIEEQYNADLTYKDLRFLKYLRAKSVYQFHKSLKTYFSLFWNTVINIGNFGNTRKQLKAFIFLGLPYRLKQLLFRSKYIKSLSK